MTGLAGDRVQLLGWRFDREVSSRMPGRRLGLSRPGGAQLGAVALEPAPTGRLRLSGVSWPSRAATLPDR